MMFDQFKTKLQPESGRIIISDPFLNDPNFSRTVALLCSHTNEGSLGFVLNRVSDLYLTDIIELDINSEIPIYLGGPVGKDYLHFIHREPLLSENCEEILPGIYWGVDFEKMTTLLNLQLIDGANIKFFLGYSGWGEGQLIDEIDEQSWIVANAHPDIIFADPNEEIWKNTLKSMGGAFKLLSNAPENPMMN